MARTGYHGSVACVAKSSRPRYALYQEGPFKFKIRQIRAVRDSEVPAFGQVPALVLSDAKAWMLVKATCINLLIST